MVRSGKPVTIQVTTAPANAGPCQYQSDDLSALTCRNATQRDLIRRDERPWQAGGQGFESPKLHQEVFTFQWGPCSRLGLTFRPLGSPWSGAGFSGAATGLVSLVCPVSGRAFSWLWLLSWW